MYESGCQQETDERRWCVGFLEWLGYLELKWAPKAKGEKGMISSSVMCVECWSSNYIHICKAMFDYSYFFFKLVDCCVPNAVTGTGSLSYPAAVDVPYRPPH